MQYLAQIATQPRHRLFKFVGGSAWVVVGAQAATLFSECAYSSTKGLRIRHKVVQRRKLILNLLGLTTPQLTFLEQFDLPVD